MGARLAKLIEARSDMPETPNPPGRGRLCAVRYRLCYVKRYVPGQIPLTKVNPPAKAGLGLIDTLQGPVYVKHPVTVKYP